MEQGRQIGVAMDFSKGSKIALKWASECLLKNGDTLYILHVRHSAASESRNHIWAATGSPSIPLSEFRDESAMHGYGFQLDHEVLDMLDSIAKDLQVTIVGKVYWGDAREKICEAAGSLKLDALVMGSRGLGRFQRVLLGSVTSYVIENAACPVSVVKDPEATHERCLLGFLGVFIQCWCLSIHLQSNPGSEISESDGVSRV
ncbi:hypothetical protein V2J09_019102 [Rumex salicifolius]